MLNFALLKQPLNWITVWAMLALAAFAGHYAFKLASGSSSTEE